MSPVRMCSVDPGEQHCGVVLWIDATPYDIREYTPDVFLQILERWAWGEAIDVVVCEDFRLYPDKMREQGYSQMRTPRVIGAIEHICGKNGIKLVLQGASIKKPTRSQLQARGVEIRAVTQQKGVHCTDAELHGWYFLRNGGAGGR